LSDVGSFELEHVAQCCVTLNCRVGRCNLVVYDEGKHNGLYRNEIKDT